MKVRVENTEKFFNRINKCVAPIIMTLPDGEKVDIRNNWLVRHICSITQEPPVLFLTAENANDAVQIVQFIM